MYWKKGGERGEEERKGEGGFFQGGHGSELVAHQSVYGRWLVIVFVLLICLCLFVLFCFGLSFT